MWVDGCKDAFAGDGDVDDQTNKKQRVKGRRTREGIGLLLIS